MLTLSYHHRLATGDYRAFLYVAGIASVQAAGLGLEWRPHRVEYVRVASKRERLDLETTLLTLEVRRRLIPWVALESVEFSGGLLSSGRLTIRARAIATLDGLPGAVNESWLAHVAWSNRRRAREFVLAAEAELERGASLETT